MNLELLSELCRTPGGPGREERVREVAIRELKPLVDSIDVDRMGNVVATRKPRGRAGGKKAPRRVMLSAHMDEIGFMVSHIDDTGFLRLLPLGGFDPKTLTAQRVTVHGREDLLGVLGGKAVHLMTDEEKRRPPKLEDYFVDLGLPVERVRELVRPGDVVTRERAMARLATSSPARASTTARACT
jgi:endoglucanase